VSLTLSLAAVAGCYLHVPFRHAPSDAARRRFLRAVRRDATRRVAAHVAPGSVHTLLVGGPRPSRLGASGLADVVRMLSPIPGLDALAEATVEVHAADVAPADLPVLADAGCTRLSLRPSSRAQLDAATIALLDAARDTFPAVSVDLRFGGPRPTLAQWRALLDAVVRRDVAHVTLIEECGGPPEHAERGLALAQKRLTAAGFRPYELTHWARPGHESQHIVRQYAYGTIFGLGPGAESFWRGPGADHPVFRTRTAACPDRYALRLARGASPLVHRRRLPRRTRACEYLMLRLRTADGLALQTLHHDYGIDLPRDHGPLLERLQTAGHLVRTNGHLRLTRSGRARADGIISALLPR
jgi:oxygen-independent coproporphyrinogen-3 oxidase